MNGKIFPAIVAGLLAILVGTWAFTFSVDERQSALIIRLGQINNGVKGPGLHFKLPFVDEVVYIEDRIIALEGEDKRVQVSDGRRYIVDAVTLFRISDQTRFRQTVQARLDLAKQRLETRLDAALRDVYASRTFESALSEGRITMMREIADKIRPDANALGLEIVDVRIKRTDLVREVLDRTYERMKAERLKEAEELRAEGNRRSISIRAQADRQYVTEIADAAKDSEILRGEGDAERNSIFGQAYGQDQEFFAFYRSMKAYERAMQDTGTTMVLSPDSEFFRFFGNMSGVPKPKTE